MKNFSNNYWQNIYESKLSEEREGQNEMNPMITTVINVYMKSVRWGRLEVFIFCQFFTYSSFNDQKNPTLCNNSPVFQPWYLERPCDV